MNNGYPTSKNRVSMGLSLAEDRMARLRKMATEDKVSTGEKVGQLVDAEWDRRSMSDNPLGKKETVAA